MPKGPKGQKRRGDVIAKEVHVMRIATGEIQDATEPTGDGKNPAAVALGRMGGKARASALSPHRRRQIAKRAAAKRWGKS